MQTRGHVPTTTVIVLIRRASVYGMEVNHWKESEGRRTLTSKGDIEPTTAGSSQLGMERTLIQEDITRLGVANQQCHMAMLRCTHVPSVQQQTS